MASRAPSGLPSSLSNEELAEHVVPARPDQQEYQSVAPVTLTLEGYQFEQPTYRRKEAFIRTETHSPLWTESGEEESTAYIATPHIEFEVAVPPSEPAAGAVSGWFRNRLEPNGTVSFADTSASCLFRVEGVRQSDITPGGHEMVTTFSLTPRDATAFREVLVAANIEREAILAGGERQ